MKPHPWTSLPLSPISTAPLSVILPVEELEHFGQRVRLAGRTIVSTNGCFDLLHTGHLYVLREAAKLADILVVLVNADASVRRLKGEARPVVVQRERVELLLAVRWVDAVCLFDDDTPVETLARLRPAGGPRCFEADAPRWERVLCGLHHVVLPFRVLR